MTEQPSNRKPLSPLEQFANVCDAICDDELFDAQVEVDEQRSKVAMGVMRAAIAEALAAAPLERATNVMPPRQGVPDNLAGPVQKAPAQEPPASKAEMPSKKTNVSVITGDRWLPPAQSSPPAVRSPQLPARRYAAANQFIQTFGLHPVTAIVLTGVNLALFSAALGTMGTSLIFSIPVGFVVGAFAYKAQKKWYGDNKRFAYIKALILAILTAIPIPTALLFVPAGILGFFRRKTRENQETQVR